MRLALQIAWRYLWSKKSTNAIHVITGISLLGLSIGTAAMILIMSVFNGFEGLLINLYASFNPDLKVLPVSGKYFSEDSIHIDQIKQIDGVEAVSVSLEETAMFIYKDRQDFGKIKGVDSAYAAVNGVDSMIRYGRYDVSGDPYMKGVVGLGIDSRLGIDLEDEFASLHVYMPERKNRGPFAQPFRQKMLYPAGIFSIQADFDNEYVIAPLALSRYLLGTPKGCSALEINVKNSANISQVKDQISVIVGDQYIAKTRLEQDATFLKLTNIEKWVAFVILSFTVLLVAINLIGCLWMIVLDKTKDISILLTMGMDKTDIRKIFLLEGMLITILGIFAGLIISITLIILQQQFGLFRIPEGFIINAYPVKLKFYDILAVCGIVSLLGFIASFPAAIQAYRVSSLIRSE